MSLAKDNMHSLHVGTQQKFLPTAKEMQAFASNFSKEQWAKLCSNQKFLDKFTIDMNYCIGLAERILTNKLTNEDKS